MLYKKYPVKKINASYIGQTKRKTTWTR